VFTIFKLWQWQAVFLPRDDRMTTFMKGCMLARAIEDRPSTEV
jgi:hypothetical protein